MNDTANQEEANGEFGIPQKHEDFIGGFCMYTGAIALTAYAYYWILAGAYEAYMNGKFVATLAGANCSEFALNIEVLFFGWMLTGFVGAAIGIVVAVIIWIIYSGLLHIAWGFRKIFSYNIAVR